MTVKVSPKYQVVIPQVVRESLKLKAGSKVDVIAKGGIAYLVPVSSTTHLQERLKGKLSRQDVRDKRDRL